MSAWMGNAAGVLTTLPDLLTICSWWDFYMSCCLKKPHISDLFAQILPGSNKTTASLSGRKKIPEGYKSLFPKAGIYLSAWGRREVVSVPKMQDLRIWFIYQLSKEWRKERRKQSKSRDSTDYGRHRQQLNETCSEQEISLEFFNHGKYFQISRTETPQDGSKEQA